MHYVLFVCLTFPTSAATHPEKRRKKKVATVTPSCRICTFGWGSEVRGLRSQTNMGGKQHTERAGGSFYTLLHEIGLFIQFLDFYCSAAGGERKQTIILVTQSSCRQSAISVVYTAASL